MLFTLACTSPEVFEQTGLAAEVLFLRLFSLLEDELLLTIYQASKERSKTLLALIEGAPVESKHQGLLKVSVAWCLESLTFENTLPFGHFQSFLFNFDLQLEYFTQLLSDRWHTI